MEDYEVCPVLFYKLCAVSTPADFVDVSIVHTIVTGSYSRSTVQRLINKSAVRQPEKPLYEGWILFTARGDHYYGK